MENISKEDLRDLKIARSYLMRETNPSFKSQSRYQQLFVDKANEYKVGLQELHDYIQTLIG